MKRFRIVYAAALAIVAVAWSGHALAQSPTPTPELKMVSIEIRTKYLEISEEAWKRVSDKSFGTMLSKDAETKEGSGSAMPPELMSVQGVLTQKQLSQLLTDLEKEKEAEVLSAPKIVSRSGRKALVRTVREFPYPTEFLPEKNSPQGLVPTSFEVRNVGVTVEVEPVVGPDGKTIDMELSPELVELTGFVKLNGQPVAWTHEGLKDFFNPPAGIFPKNEPVQPIFSTRKIQTHVNLCSGQSILLGGLKKAADAGGKGKGNRLLFMIVQAIILKPDGTPIFLE